MITPAASAKSEFLRRAEETPRARRSAEVRDLLEALEWCDLNSSDPQAEPGALSVAHGGDHLTRCGGDGTPDVAQLCAAEYAVARQEGERATWNLMADALDLRHRLPLMWARGQELVCEIWVLRRIAVMARRLTKKQAARVDSALAEALSQSPGRILQLAEARIIEADPRAHAAQVKEDNARRGVWFPKPLPGEQLQAGGISGSRRVAARLKPGQAGELDHTLDVIADHLADEYAADPDAEMPTRDQLRAEALALLADPHAAAAVIEAGEADPEAAIVEQRPEPRRKTARRAQVLIHLDAETLADGADGDADGIVRVEGYGPVLLSQLAELLGRCDITLTPVIDLRTFTSVNAYEHPATMRRRTELRTVGDVFPYSSHRPGHGAVDHDHPMPYEPSGPPGQTSDLNDAPLSRRHHRAKTHHPYVLHQTGPGQYEWTTPHGLRRVVDRAGTHVPGR